MLTTATAAVPVYFAVLKYLGAEAVGGTTFSRVGVLPPLLFLAAAIIFALALRPRFAWIKHADFADFRMTRLKQLNRAMLVGLAVFAVGIFACHCARCRDIRTLSCRPTAPCRHPRRHASVLVCKSTASH